MSWRNWMFGRLTASPIATQVPNGSVFSGGSITTPPEDFPFIVYRLQDKVARIKDDSVPQAVSQFAEVWVYDEPGSYDRIDTIIQLVRSELVGPVASPGKTCCEWSGDSGELADDEWKAITRNATFQLIGAS